MTLGDHQLLGAEALLEDLTLSQGFILMDSERNSPFCRVRVKIHLSDAGVPSLPPSLAQASPLSEPSRYLPGSAGQDLTPLMAFSPLPYDTSTPSHLSCPLLWVYTFLFT